MDPFAIILRICCILFVSLAAAQEKLSTTSSSSPPLRAHREDSINSAGTGGNRKYSVWTKWTHCSRTCEQKRFRTCILINDKECPHGPLHLQTRTCARGKCHVPKSRPVGRLVDDLYGSNTLYEEFFFTSWARWTHCHPKECKQYRWKLCSFYPICGERLMVQQRTCPDHAAQLCEERKDNMIPIALASPLPGSDAIAPSDFDMDDSFLGNTNASSCGVPVASSTSSTMTKKIFGGKASTQGRWPWQVAILNHYMENYCAGTLISNWVLTAAHCVRKRMFIKLGEHNVLRDEETEQIFRPTRMVIHRGFDSNTIENDIALLKISDNIRWGTHAHPACLPESTDDSSLLQESTKCMIVGWGKRKASARSGADVLHEAPVQVIEQQRCKDAYQGDHPISPRMLCAGSGKNGRSDTCEGDSGGGLICQVGENSHESPWRIMGITSFGDGCGKKDKFGVYTRVSAYLEWINQVLEEN